MFEARDRKGELRAIAGGGRYDQLLQTFGGQQQPCAGFGFGDAVIMELLKDLGLLPQFEHKVVLPPSTVVPVLLPPLLPNISVVRPVGAGLRSTNLVW